MEIRQSAEDYLESILVLSILPTSTHQESSGIPNPHYHQIQPILASSAYEDFLTLNYLHDKYPIAEVSKFPDL